MYPLDRGVWGPIARITNLRDQLATMVELDVIAAERGPRRGALARYAVSGRLRGLDGIYVENSSTLPSETDIAFLALARTLGIPVLTYIRDAQHLFDEYYPVTSLKRRVARWLFRPTIGALRRVSTRAAYPSIGLARAVGEPDPDPILLPPGSPPPADVPRRPGARALLFVGAMRYPVHGLDLLLGAIERVRTEGNQIDLICVSRPGEEPPEPRPSWIRVERASGDGIRALLPEVIATIQPRLRSPYNDLAVPIKVMEYLSYGRPLLVTDCTEQARIVREAGAGIVVADEIDALADGIRRIALADDATLEGWSSNARESAARSSWADRSRSIVDLLSRL